MKYKLIIMLSVILLLGQNCFSQFGPYDKSAHSTYTPLSPQEIMAPAMIMKQRYDNNAAKVDALIKYVLELKTKTNDQQFLAYLDGWYQSLKKLYKYDLARMDNDIRECQMLIQEGIDVHVKRINRDGYYNQGLKEAKNELHELAIVYYQKALEIDPDYAPAYCLMGISYSILNNHNQAIIYFQKAITINPDYPSAYYGLGVSYGALKNVEQQIAYLKRAAQLGNTSSQEWLKKNGYNW